MNTVIETAEQRIADIQNLHGMFMSFVSDLSNGFEFIKDFIGEEEKFCFLFQYRREMNGFIEMILDEGLYFMQGDFYRNLKKTLEFVEYISSENILWDFSEGKVMFEISKHEQIKNEFERFKKDVLKHVSDYTMRYCTYNLESLLDDVALAS